jgi:hypothetical protein
MAVVVAVVAVVEAAEAAVLVASRRFRSTIG